jgi:hypothetical protein
MADGWADFVRRIRSLLSSFEHGRLCAHFAMLDSDDE